MSKEHAIGFLKELARNQAMQKEVIEGLVVVARNAQFQMTPEELKEALAATGSIRLSDADLDKVAGGAFPTAVNNQITDSVT